MSEPDARHLLGGHATETLTKTERERLMRAVLEDTQLFEAFVEEEEWRAVIEKVQDQIRGKIVPADVFDEAQRFVKEYRAAGGTGGEKK